MLPSALSTRVLRPSAVAVRVVILPSALSMRPSSPVAVAVRVLMSPSALSMRPVRLVAVCSRVVISPSAVSTRAVMLVAVCSSVLIRPPCASTWLVSPSAVSFSSAWASSSGVTRRVMASSAWLISLLRPPLSILLRSSSLKLSSSMSFRAYRSISCIWNR